MRVPAILCAVLASFTAVPAMAQETVVIEEVIVEHVDAGAASGASRLVSSAEVRVEQAALASYGPFRVLEGNRAALVGVTDTGTPTQFAAMLRDYPAIDTLEFVECPGTLDDHANLRLGRMIRDNAIAAEVPADGSVRSGAVELFLAGSTRRIADGAQFAVHAWLDDRGMDAWDYAPDSAEHLKYLSYYREMGMGEEEAARFYAMTNSAPFDDALWLSGVEMRGWIAAEGLEGAQLAARPEMAYAKVL